ncbi:hypothetical protein Tco_1332086, partial [Tanacetum coccineum]
SKLLLGVNWSSARITIKHLCLLKNLGSIFCLRQEYARERTMLTFGGRGTSTQVLLSMRALYSSHIAYFQLGSRRAWKRYLGIGEEVVTCKLYLGLAFTIPTLERVTIGCYEVGGGGGGVVGGVGVVCGGGVDRGVGGVDCRVVCGFVCGVICGSVC